MIPKIKFEVKPLRKYQNVLYYFLNHTGWDKRIFREYPTLEKRLKLAGKFDKRNRIVYDFFDDIEKREKTKFNIKRKIFQKSWDKINDNSLRALSEINEIDWSNADRFITAYVTLNPICPRYIKDRSFDLFYKFNIKQMRTVSLHELLHFIYFKKWKQVFPKTPEREFEGPSLVWELSEMVPAAILSDKRIQIIHKHEPTVYDEYKKLEIRNKPILDYLQEFYDDRDDFEDFLRTSWDFVKKIKGRLLQS